MNSKRLYFLLIGIIGLLAIGLVAGTYGANKVMTARATSLTALKAKSAAQTSEQTSLTRAREEVKKYTDLEEIAKSIVPQDKDQAEAVREIVNIAAQAGVNLAAINFNASTLGTTGTGAASASSTASSVSPTAGSSGGKASALSQLTPVKNIPGVYVLPITVVGDPNKPVAYDKFVNFLSILEHNRRTAQVSTITITPNTSNRNLLTFTLGINEYIKP